MKTKVNEIPLVGPKGRKELLNRINELEAQIAQQDYVIIDVPGETALDNPSVWPSSFWDVLEEKFKLGVLLHVVLRDRWGSIGRVLSYDTYEDSLSAVTYVGVGELHGWEKPE